MMRIGKAAAVALLFLSSTGCALYNEVSVGPLILLPSNIDRGADVQSMLRKADYLHAIELTSSIQNKQRRTAVELGALGSAYLTCGRFDDARTHLRAALDLEPFRVTRADIAWDLSQVEYLSNNFELSLEWALIAEANGLQIRKWHIDYLRALTGTQVYRVSGSTRARMPFKFGRPEVPRIAARVNGHYDVDAIVDSGAVLSIISTRMASALPVRSLGEFEGTFYGLLGEPIAVTFGILETLELGDLTIENVPVAIMPDSKMRFLINKKEGREFNMDFLLGSNLLKEFRLDFDFGSKDLTFTHLTAQDHRPDAEQNLFYEGFRPHVRGTINRKGWFLFVLDTGSEITFLNEARLQNLPVQTFASRGHSATLQGLGGAMKHGAKLDNVEIGVDRWGGTFKTLPMYSTEGKESAVGILGQNFMKNFNVVVDFGRMRIDLERR